MSDQNPFSKDSRRQRVESPGEIGSTLKVTALPVYLLALTALLLIGAFFVWGFLGSVSDKVYYSGVVFPQQGTTWDYIDSMLQVIHGLGFFDDEKYTDLTLITVF